MFRCLHIRHAHKIHTRVLFRCVPACPPSSLLPYPSSLLSPPPSLIPPPSSSLPLPSPPIPPPSSLV